MYVGQAGKIAHAYTQVSLCLTSISPKLLQVFPGPPKENLLDNWNSGFLAAGHACGRNVFKILLLLLVLVLTSPTGAVAKYCDEHVFVCVCLSV